MPIKRAESGKKAANPPEILANEGARRLGLTHQAIGQWTAKPGAPVRKEGARVYLLWPAFARWREQELCRQAVEEATAKYRNQLNEQGEESPRARQERANARKAEIEVELLEKSVIPIEQAVAIVEKLLTALRAALVALPRVWAPKLLGAKTVIELEQRLEAENVRLMEALSSPDFGHEPEPMREAA